MALSGNALTTLATVKEELGNPPSLSDSYLERLINAASDRISEYCNRVFQYEADISEDSPGFGESDLLLTRTPIISVDSVSFDGTEIDSTNYLVKDPAAGVLYRATGWRWTASHNQGIVQDKRPGSEDPSFTIVYTGGYITPQQEIDAVGTRTLPYDLEDVCVAMVKNRTATKGQESGVKSEKLMSYSVTYADADRNAITKSMKETLAKYARWVQA